MEKFVCSNSKENAELLAFDMFSLWYDLIKQGTPDHIAVAVVKQHEIERKPVAGKIGL